MHPRSRSYPPFSSGATKAYKQWLEKYSRVTSTEANFWGIRLIHLRQLREILFLTTASLSAAFRLGSPRLSGLSADQAPRLKYR